MAQSSSDMVDLGGRRVRAVRADFRASMRLGPSRPTGNVRFVSPSPRVTHRSHHAARRAAKMRFADVSGLRAAGPLATKVGLMHLGSSRPTGTLAPSTATRPATHPRA